MAFKTKLPNPMKMPLNDPASVTPAPISLDKPVENQLSNPSPKAVDPAVKFGKLRKIMNEKY